MSKARKLFIIGGSLSAVAASAQVPDMMTALDAGGRALGAGSAFNATTVSTLSATYNPAALAFINRSTAGIAARTVETTKTTVTGEVNDLRLDSKSDVGGYRGTHFGFALPLKRGPGTKGVIAVAWTVGGWHEDTQQGSNLANGVATYLDFTKAQTDFINLSYGTANGSQTFAWGAGLVFAQQNVRNFQRITFTDQNIPPQQSDTDTTGTGIGFQAGLLLTPAENPNLSFGVSARTPIKVKHSGSPLALYEQIPGRVAAGLALRRDGFRGGRDFLILGGEVQHFFNGKDSPRLDRQNQTTAHFGAEYNWNRGETLIPIRLGYAVIPSGGDGFASRNGFTYGFGYRPAGSDWEIDINFGRPESGGADTSIFLTWRFGK